MKTCSVCGRQVETTVKCLYQRHGLETCPDCCEKCHKSEPFPCREYEKRNPKPPTGGKSAAKKWAEVLDLPEGQAIPCVVAFACLRYHGKSFVRKLADGTGQITIWQSLKIGIALFRWDLAQKRDPWGELYRITKFAQKWKEGDSL